MSKKHPKNWVMVWGSTRPAVSIGCEKPESSNDSGYTVIFSDAPDPADVPENAKHPGISSWCLACLRADYPEIVPGLDIAHEYGVADLDDDQWVAGDQSRLEADQGRRR